MFLISLSYQGFKIPYNEGGGGNGKRFPERAEETKVMSHDGGECTVAPEICTLAALCTSYLHV